MTLPDSGWVEKLGNAPTIALIGLCAETGAVWAGGEGWGLIDSTSPGWLKAGLAGVCIGSGAMLAWKASRYAVQRLRAWHGCRPRKRFEELSKEQQALLAEVYKKGTRHFDMPIEGTKARWFEELERWNYLKGGELSVYVGGSPWPYHVTEKGWHEIERKLRRNTTEEERP